MIINPIIPVWLMGILCIVFLFMKRKGTFNYIRQIFIIALLFVINLRVMVGNGEAQTVMAEADILFVVDNTISMFAEDYNGSGRRMDAVREDCGYILEQLPGASYSVVSFGNSVQSLTPYTTDVSITEQAMDSLKGQATLYATGTSLNNVLKELPDILDDARDNYQVVFFISDGEITSDESLKNVSGIDKYIDAGAVLGYGTERGGPMRAVAFIGSEDAPEYITYYDDDFEEQNAVSKIDEDNLRSIADNLGLDYVHMKEQSEIDRCLQQVKQGIESAPKIAERDTLEGYSDTYYWFVIPLLILLGIDFIYYRKRNVI
ncbi:MAG: VWA domain-containing protein [Lachnospiraceae bacterium]|nr:VWA domain-containing protein [Lachnospiraceae bacterium]